MVEVTYFIPLIIIGSWAILITIMCCALKKCAKNQQQSGNVILVNGNTNRIYPAQAVVPIGSLAGE